MQHPIVVLAMGRRWGKTVLGLVLVIYFAGMGARCAWVVPAYKNGRPLWQMLRRTLGALKALGLVRLSETERTVEFVEAHRGGYVGIYTGDDNCDAMRGDAFDLVVIDEAAKLSEMAWTDAILPTLADRNGKAVLISTPRGRNWFWRLWAQGQDETQQQVRSFTAPSAANPIPQIRRAAELAKAQVSTRTYEQEWLAIFVDDGGEVMRFIEQCLDDGLRLLPTPPNRVTQYVMGLDLAKHLDYTAYVIADATTRQVVAFDRWQHDSWPVQKARIALTARQWNNALVLVDSTGVGDAVYDDLRLAGLRIEPYRFTAASKDALVDTAIVMTEQRAITLPRLGTEVLVNELKALEYTRLPSGRDRVAAPDGMHDDAAMAFLLLCFGLRYGSAGGMPRSSTGFSWEQLIEQQTAIGGASLLRKGIF